MPALVLWMPGPRSFTREDVAEFHLPGTPALLSRALERLLELGAALAMPGEFTRRAFENGRIDLTQAEGVLELVEAESESERKAAAALLSGGLSERLKPLRDKLDDLRALCEASLDFDSEDTGAVPESELLQGFDDADAGLEEALGFELARVRSSGLPRIVFAGAPNAGKSSLFNRLGEAGEALVTDHSGTTRDVLETVWVVSGVACELADVAGLERGLREPERRAQELSRERRRGADLVLWVVDATRTDEEALLAEAHELQSEAKRLLVWSQTDRVEAAPEPPSGLLAASDRWCAVSAETGVGLRELASAAAKLLGLGAESAALSGAAADGGEVADSFVGGGGLARELSVRHRASLVGARAEIESARTALQSGASLEFIAEILRSATEALDGISGSTTSEDVLDRIFSRFCLGK